VTTWSELADAVRGCAARPAGAVHVAGRPGGLIRLRAGAVVGTWTSGTPLAVPSPEPGARSAAATAGPLARLAMTDAVFVMAAGRIGPWRAEDDPSPDAGGVRMDLDDLLAEVDRRMRRVSGPDGLLPPEETVVRRVERSTAWRALAPTPEERRLLGVLEVRPDAPRGSAEARTVHDLAFALGRGVFAVLLDVQRLAAMGAVVLEARGPAPEVEPLLVQARSTLDGPAVAAVSAALRRHRVGMTADHAADPEPPVATSPRALRAVPPPTAPSEPAATSTGPPHAAPAAAAAPGTSPRTLARRVPGAADRARRKVPWSSRRQPNQGDGQQ
jgi:hypothetical protein